MLKMASGVVAKTVGPRGFMWGALATVATAVPATFWVYGASAPLIVWLSLNGVALLVFMMIDFNWVAAYRPPVLWSVLAEWQDNAQPSWLRLILWMFLIPAEIAATFVLWPITLAIRALLKPMPGKWD